MPAGGENSAVVVVAGRVVVGGRVVVVDVAVVGSGADVVVAAGSVDSHATGAMQRTVAIKRRPG